MWFVNFIEEFIGAPSILIGLFTIVGGLLLKKKASEIVTSFFTVVLGFLIFGGGAGMIVGALDHFSPVFNSVFGLDGILPTNEGVAGVMQQAVPKVLTVASIIMIAAMASNLLLAGVSRFKYVYLSGHIMYYFSLMFAIIFYKSGMDVENNAGDFALAVFSGAMLFGMYMTLQPAATQRWMRRIVGNNEVALGHSCAIGYVVSGFIGEGIAKLSKKPLLKTEDIKFPQGLLFLRNTMVSVPITMALFYLIAYLPGGIMHEMGTLELRYNSGGVQVIGAILDPSVTDVTPIKDAVDMVGGKNWLVTSFIQACTFAAGMEVLMFGVRTFLGQLIPTFKGFSNRLIKDAKASVDCPITFPFAPNAVMIGFISAFVGMLIGLGVTIGIGSAAGTAVVLPSIVNAFFMGATTAIIGNTCGGIKGAIIGALIGGVLATFVPLIFIVGEWNASGMLTPAGDPISNAGILAWGDTDYLAGVIPGVLSKWSKWAIFGFSIFAFIGLIVDGILARKYKWGIFNENSKNRNDIKVESFNRTPVEKTSTK